MTAADTLKASLIGALHPTMARLPESGIVKVFDYGRSKPGIIPLWAGEGDLPTPQFICDAAARSLKAGETFYTHQGGIPDLRKALARYYARIYQRPFEPAEFFVTLGGMQAIQLAMQAIVGDGDEVIVPSPAWPNFEGAVVTQGGRVRHVAMTLSREGWTLPLDDLFAAAGPRTRAIVINSPANPSGWTANREELAAILDFARARGLWIVADEIYARFVYDQDLAPSFLEHRRAGDRIILVNTFSKNWAMTGWRLGWLQAPPELTAIVESLIQYNTSGVPVFMQRGGIAALEEGETFLAEQIARARRGRDIVSAALAGRNDVGYVPASGAFYAFFSIAGLEDSLAAALRLVDEADVGLAPGSAFGPGAEGCFRVCFQRSAEPLGEAMARLGRWLGQRERPLA